MKAKITGMLTVLAFALGLTSAALADTATFLGDDTWVVPGGVTSVDYLVVGGGGGGGGQGGGGGGGGEFLTGSLSVTPSETLTITVGGGGTAASGVRGGNGGASVLSGGSGTVTANGGGGGGAVQNNGQGNGGAGTGSAGGNGWNSSFTLFPVVAGGNGGTGGQWGQADLGGGGGGGAGGNGADGVGDSGQGAGGAGLSSTISGSEQWYAGGGGGAAGDASAPGGIGGGGNGGRGWGGGPLPTAGTANTGGGGGGGDDDPGIGGSGIVILSYTTGGTTTTAAPTSSTTSTTVTPTTSSTTVTPTTSTTTSGTPPHSWNGLDNGLWSVPGNWVNSKPSAKTLAEFSQVGAGANVDVDAGAVAGSILFNNNVANTELKSTGAQTLLLDNGGANCTITASDGTHTISADFDATTGGGGAGAGVEFNGPGKLILSGNNTMGKPGVENHNGFRLNTGGDVEITGSTATLIPSAADPIAAANGWVRGTLTVSGTGSFLTGGHDYGMGGTITLKDQGDLTFVDTGIFDTGTEGAGVLTVQDDATLTVDRTNTPGGGGGPYQDAWTVGGIILGMGWGNSSSIINQDGGTVNLPYFQPWLTGNGWGLCYGPGSWGATRDVDGTYNLNGGVLNVSAIGAITDSGGVLVPPETGNALTEANFNFNGGLLRATQSDSTDAGAIAEGSAHLMFNLTHAYVKAGGARIDTDGFDCSINQPLEHDPALGGTPDGGLDKSGAGTLSLLKDNTYTGPTKVTAGKLRTTSATCLDSSTDVYLYTGGVRMNLDFAGNQVVNALYIDDVMQANGTYGSTASPAATQDDTLFDVAGVGVLQVGAAVTTSTTSSTSTTTVPPTTSSTTTTTVPATTSTTTIGPNDADFQTWNGGDPFPGADWRIDNDEVGWVIEYWLGTGDYHVEPLSPTGYLAGPGSQAGPPHNADFQTWNGGDPLPGADWKIDNDEVGWVIEYWLGTGEYHVEPLSPTGYAPGP